MNILDPKSQKKLKTDFENDIIFYIGNTNMHNETI